MRRIEQVFRTGQFFCGNGKAALYALVKGDGGLFTGEDAVEAAWMVVDQVPEHHPRVRPYKRGTWGRKQAALIEADGGWHNPVSSKG